MIPRSWFEPWYTTLNIFRPLTRSYSEAKRGVAHRHSSSHVDVQKRYGKKSATGSWWIAGDCMDEGGTFRRITDETAHRSYDIPSTVRNVNNRLQRMHRASIRRIAHWRNNLLAEKSHIYYNTDKRSSKMNRLITAVDLNHMAESSG